MKINVKKELCIGCGACAAIASTIFEIDDDGLAKVIGENISSIEEAVDASESCPTGAIKIEENK